MSDRDRELWDGYETALIAGDVALDPLAIRWSCQRCGALITLDRFSQTILVGETAARVLVLCVACAWALAQRFDPNVWRDGVGSWTYRPGRRRS